ncbi:MAG: FliI/YscN family ATPase [Planctomycetota bacterium]|nr:MAG: FliI/YscN family ATPase [Planctomycetota bacterium]REK44489.1 MAG: FliI/YscN family ATPase [Planctomycetota bacterium]
MIDFAPQLDEVLSTEICGSVVETVGMTASVADLPVPLGAIVEIDRDNGGRIPAEVVGFRDQLTLVYPLRSMTGVRRGHRVRLHRTASRIPVGEALLGRVINAEGRVIDGYGQPAAEERLARERRAPSPVERPRIDTPLSTGIRAIDGLLTCGRGQRMGIFSGSGVGKSVTLGMMAKYTSADVIVIGLVGERGREVNEFLERDLGPRGRARSVVVVATSDEPALARVHAASTATSVAEYFRDRGKDVLLLMDSLTRVAMAQREIGLAAGEPPTTRGYPPSVFAMLPKLVERAGRTARGSITGFYSVLVEGDDANEPISDAVRGLLDGHTWLSRKLASQGHYPAIDVLDSISRLMPEVASPEQRQAATIVRELLAAYRDHEDLISIGAYRAGSNPTVDIALAMRDDIAQFLRQQVDEACQMETTQQALMALAHRTAAVSQQAAQVVAPAETTAT